MNNLKKVHFLGKSYFSRLMLLFVLAHCNVSMAKELLLLSNANIVDPEYQVIRRGHLLIEDRLISATLNEIPPAFSGKIIDIKGKWIIPGLNELHTHSFGNRAPNVKSEFIGTPAVAERLLSVGVTSLLDLFADEDIIYSQRELQRAGKLKGADIFTSLSCLTASKGHCTHFGLPTREMNSPEEALDVVTELAKRSPDVIKIVYDRLGKLPSISKATLTAAISKAKALGLKTVIHINTVDGMRDAVLAGASALTHLPNDEEVPSSLAKLMADNNVASIPTLVSDTDMVDFIKDPSVLSTPLARQVTSKQILDAYKEEKIGLSKSEIDAMYVENQMFYHSTKTLADAGVLMLTGTDSGGYGTIQGYSIHRELIKFVTSGMSTWQALSASTTNAGKFLGKNYGVNPGDEANLVILQGSPIDDISNTQKIYLVIHHGRIINTTSSKYTNE